MILWMDSLTSFAAKYLIIVPVAAVVYMLLNLKGQKRKDFFILLVGVGILSLLFAKVGGHLYDDPRPYIKDGVTPLFAHSGDPNGFPSDHTLFSAFVGFVALSYSKKIGIILLVIAGLIGWARVAAGVHHFIDIIGSFAITGIAYLIVSSVMKKNGSKHAAHKAQN
jgi:undecaprenyl-diphosphatase